MLHHFDDILKTGIESVRTLDAFHDMHLMQEKHLTTTDRRYAQQRLHKASTTVEHATIVIHLHYGP